MLRFAICFFMSFGFVCPLFAQFEPYNPYAPEMEDPSPVRPDGKLNWPKFFKSQKLEARFQTYFAMGSCVGTKRSINEMLKNNKVDINELAERSVSGHSLSVRGGNVTLVDASGHGFLVFTHPAGVTRVRVSGKMPPAGLRPGMTVRFASSVDQRGQGKDVLNALEVITPTKDITPKPVETGRYQTIIGTLTRVDGQKIRVKAAVGKRRYLNFALSDHPTVHVNGGSLDLISAGDEITVKGHVLAGQLGKNSEIVFADDIEVLKRDTPPVASTAKPADLLTGR